MDVNDHVDFYVLSTTHLNENCTADLKTGLAPLNGNFDFTMVFKHDLRMFVKIKYV